MASANLEIYRDALLQAILRMHRRCALETLSALSGGSARGATELTCVICGAARSVPAELLERRPDVAAAERRIAAAFNRVEESKVALLPLRELTGVSNVLSEPVRPAGAPEPGGQPRRQSRRAHLPWRALRANIDIRTAEQEQARRLRQGTCAGEVERRAGERSVAAQPRAGPDAAANENPAHLPASAAASARRFRASSSSSFSL